MKGWSKFKLKKSITGLNCLLSLLNNCPFARAVINANQQIYQH